jgi:hypothetical protein
MNFDRRWFRFIINIYINLMVVLARFWSSGLPTLKYVSSLLFGCVDERPSSMFQLAAPSLT